MGPILTKILMGALRSLLENFKKIAAESPEKWDDLVAEVLSDLLARFEAQGGKLDRPTLVAILGSVQSKFI